MRSRNPLHAAIGVFLWGCFQSAGASAGIAVVVTPSHPLMDERIRIAVSGLRANAPIEFEARSLAQDGLWWRSRAVFRSDAHGTVDISTQAPAKGSYHDVDAMGLFWSMSPDDEPRAADHSSFSITDYALPIATRIDVRDGAKILTSTQVVRRFALTSVQAVAIRDGITAVLYRPADGLKHPGVLLIGGSDGGFADPDVAMLLASHGYAALSLAYFGAIGQPATLEHVAMEKFLNALRWMRNSANIDQHFIAIYGESRGTEPALYTAAASGIVNAVIARSPSFALWSGIAANHLPGDAAWTRNGRDLPFIANTLYPDFVLTVLWDELTGTPARQASLFDEDLERFGDTAAVEIPVEKIRGPILLLSGGDDQIWPSGMMAAKIMSRLRRLNHPFADQSVVYPGVGHGIPYTYLPMGGRRADALFATGGSEAGRVRAQRDAWPRILKFMSDARMR